MSEVLDRIASIGIVPVIANIASEEACESLTQALIAGGIPVMEITFRMPNAERYIAQVRKNHPDVAVGAGTVLTTEQAQMAIDAGAQFLVAPGLSAAIVEIAQNNQIDIIPGVSTAGDVTAALEMGITVQKFFPAEQMGGAGTVKALSAPFKAVKFVPTGGINLGNIGAYFDLSCVAACGGTYMLGKHADKGEWAEITALCKKSVQTMLDLKLVHVGINTPDPESAAATAGALSSLLLLDVAKDGNSSVFVDDDIEVMKSNYLGSNGHLGFSTRNIARAVAYYKAMGKAFNEDSAKYDAAGKLKAIYFAEEIGGFAIHLMQA